MKSNFPNTLDLVFKIYVEIISDNTSNQKAKHNSSSSCPLRKWAIADAVNEYIECNPTILTIDLRSILGHVEKISSRACVINRQHKQGINDTKKNIICEHSDIDVESRGSCTKPVATDLPKNDITSNSLNKVNPWNLIEAYKAVEAEELAEKEKDKSEKKRTQTKSYLDQQIRLKREAELKANKSDEIFVKAQFEELSRWKKEQEQVARLQKEKSLNLRKVRQEQIDKLKQKKRIEEENERLQQLREISNLKDMLKDEEEKKRQKKIQEKKKWDEFQTEQQQILCKRKLMKEKEAEMDAKLMEDMKLKLDSEEENRIKVLNDRISRTSSIADIVSRAGKTDERNNRVELEKLIIDQAAEREKSAMAKEQRRKDMEQKKKLMITKTNLKLAEEKRSRQREIQRSEEIYAIQCSKEKEALLAEEETKRLKDIRTKKEYSELLNLQKEEQERLKDSLNEMTAIEKSINKKVSYEHVV